MAMTSTAPSQGEQQQPASSVPSEQYELEYQRSEEAAMPSREQRQADLSKKRALTLIGQSILQLPIWGFAMTYGVFQEEYTTNWTLNGSASATGVIGTTQNGVMYISMPFLFALFARKWARFRQLAAIAGVIIACLGFLLSSYSTSATHLILTQGIICAIGCSLIYSTTTLTLGEYFTTSRRALAYGIVLSCKNVVGSTCPFLIRHLLDHHGFRITLRIWTAIVAASSILSLALMPSAPPQPSQLHRPRKIPWHFLRHRTFFIHALATTLQSSGYGIPQTYLTSYASQITTLSTPIATLLLTLFNIPGIISSSFFGYLCDNTTTTSSSSSSSSTPNPRPHRHHHRHPLTRFLPGLKRPSPTTLTTLSSLSSALSTFLLWGLTSPSPSAHASILPLLTLFSLTFGFFAGGYSATWGGVISEMEREAGERNEAVDAGVVYGGLNGARGVGYVLGGVVGVELLRVGKEGGGMVGASWGAYGTEYGPLIVFTGLCSALGGWGFVWRGMRGVRW